MNEVDWRVGKIGCTDFEHTKFDNCIFKNCRFLDCNLSELNTRKTVFNK